jgi:putative DNA primase/helicase
MTDFNDLSSADGPDAIRARVASLAGQPARTIDEAEITEDSLAKKFTLNHPELRYVAQWGKWMRWTGARWLEDTTLHVFDLARAICVTEANNYILSSNASPTGVRRIKSASTRAAVENLARADRAHAATTEQWDADPWLLNTPAGIVDLRTGESRAARLEDYCCRATAVAPGGDAPTWRQFLADATAGDLELQSFLQRMAGYALTGLTIEHALFFVYGTGGNGKGTFLNTLHRLIGDYARVASMETFTESKFDRHPQELASLLGARMVTAQETEAGKRWNEQRITAMTGGDPITARFMRQNEFTFIPQFKLIIAGNHKPGLRSVNEAIRRRLHLIPFTQRPEKPNPRLSEQLWTEAAGILAWAVEGAAQWAAKGLAAPSSVKAATDDYLSAEDTMQIWIDECCTVLKSLSYKSSELYKNYRDWCEERNEFVGTQKRFSQDIESRGFKIERSNGASRMLGIGLKL